MTVQQIRSLVIDRLDELCAKLSREEYKQLIEELSADMDGRLECIKEEGED